MKKLRIKNPTESDIINLINRNDIKIEESYVFHKKQYPENLKNICHLNYDLLLNEGNGKKKKEIKNFVFILNEDSDLNRNLIVKAEKLARLNPENKYFTMLNSQENKRFLKERYGIQFTTYPQLIQVENILMEKDNNIKVFPIEQLLSYKIELNNLNDLVKNLI